jgi:predicted small secreted protein
MKTPLKRIAMFIIVSALVALFGASCATTRGFGRDVGTVGDKIEKSAR